MKRLPQREPLRCKREPRRCKRNTAALALTDTAPISGCRSPKRCSQSYQRVPNGHPRAALTASETAAELDCCSDLSAARPAKCTAAEHNS